METDLTAGVLALIDSGAGYSITRTSRALRKARLWCLPVEDVVSLLVNDPLVSHYDRQLLIDRLREQRLSTATRLALRGLVVELEAKGLRAGRSQGPVFAAIRDVVSILDRRDRIPRWLRYLGLRNWQARAMAARMLKDEKLKPHELDQVVAALIAMPHHLTAELAARNAQSLSTETCLSIVLPELESDYWQSRVVEALLPRSEVDAAAVMSRWPMASLWAIARHGWTEFLPVVRPHLPSLEADWERLPIVTWALGRLRASEELDGLELRLEATPEWAEHQRIWAASEA
jgi:hypothetical protein